jgi:hypothetical protein
MILFYEYIKRGKGKKWKSEKVEKGKSGKVKKWKSGKGEKGKSEKVGWALLCAEKLCFSGLFYLLIAATPPLFTGQPQRFG